MAEMRICSLENPRHDPETCYFEVEFEEKQLYYGGLKGGHVLCYTGFDVRGCSEGMTMLDGCWCL